MEQNFLLAYHLRIPPCNNSKELTLSERRWYLLRLKKELEAKNKKEGGIEKPNVTMNQDITDIVSRMG